MAQTAQAQQKLEPPVQELFFTEVVYPQDEGETQVTIGLVVDRSRPERGTLMPVSIEYGITGRWQIDAGWDGFTQFHTSPLHNLQTARFSVGTKYSLLNIGQRPVHVAIGIDAEFAHSSGISSSAGEEGTEFEPFVAVAADLRRVTIFGSAAASMERASVPPVTNEAERPDDTGTISFGGLVVVSRIALVAEYTNRSDTLPWRINGAPILSPSVTVHPGKNWEVAIGAPMPMRHGHKPGFSMRLVKEFSPHVRNGS